MKCYMIVTYMLNTFIIVSEVGQIQDFVLHQRELRFAEIHFVLRLGISDQEL